MAGMEVVWRTLQYEAISAPCLLTGPVMSVQFLGTVTRLDYSADPVAVACEAYRRVGANLCAQLPLPSVQQELEQRIFSPGTGRPDLPWHSPEEVRKAI